MSGGATGLRRGAIGSEAKALCVLVHGRGQSPEEMESHILSRLKVDHVAFALPRAPRGAWYDAKAVDPLTASTREQLDEALELLRAEVKALRRDYPDLPLLLAGFSQGACLSIEYICQGMEQPQALVALTGCRVGTPECDRPNAVEPGLPIYLTGSNADPWIPLEAMMAAAQGLAQAGTRLWADVFPGRLHEVSDDEIVVTQAILDDLASSRTALFSVAR